MRVRESRGEVHVLPLPCDWEPHTPGCPEAAVAEQVRAFLSSDHVAETIADLVMEEQEDALADDLAAMEALRGRIADNEREQGRMVELAAKVGATDAIAES